MTTSTRSTIFLHDGNGGFTPPMDLHLHSNILRLLRRLLSLQARGRGETVIPTGDEDPYFAGMDNLKPGEQETCLVGSVGLAMQVCHKAGDELMILTSEEADGIRRERDRTGVMPPSLAQRKSA